jgi:hypothetical protein
MAGRWLRPRAAPFENIESAQEYVGLLCEALEEAAQTINGEIAVSTASTNARHLDALRLVDYKLKILRSHLLASRRLLNDLRTLRRFLLDERASDRAACLDSTSEPLSSRL